MVLTGMVEISAKAECNGRDRGWCKLRMVGTTTVKSEN